MARVVFTSHLKRYVKCPTCEVSGTTLREVLDAVFAGSERARGYVLDDQAALRKHVVIFVDGVRVRDRVGLSDPVPEHGEVHVLQALSGG